MTMMKKRLSGFVLLALLALFGARPGMAADDVLRVATFDNPPKLWTDESGAAQGFFPEVLSAIGESEGLRFDYVPCGWERCLALLKAGGVDVLPGIAHTPETDRVLRFGNQAVLQSWSHLYVRPELDGRIQEVMHLSGLRVAVQRSSSLAGALDDLAAEGAANMQILELDSHSAVFDAVAQGRVDGGLADRFYGDKNAERFGLIAAHPVLFPVTLHFAYAPELDDAIVARIDQRLAALKRDPRSAYHRAKADWLIPVPQGGIRPWQIGVLSGVAVALILTVLANVTLSRALRAQATALRAQRSRLRALFDHAPVELYLKDNDGRYVEINRRFEELFDVKNDEIVGLLPMDIHDPELAAETHAHDMAVLASGEAQIIETVAETQDGRKILHTIKFPVYDDAREISGLGAVVIDLTEEHEARGRAEQAEGRLREAIDALPSGFAAFDSEDRMVTCNHAFRTIYDAAGETIVEGMTFEEILRVGIEARQYPEAIGREGAFIAERLALRHGVGGESEQQLAGDRWLKVFDRPTSDGGMVSIRVDITATKRQQRALEGARQRAEAAARKLGEQTRKLEQVVRISGIGGWELDLDLHELSWDSITKRIHEVPLHYTPHVEEALGFFAPGSREQLREALRDAQDTLAPFDLELELVTAKGQRLWVRMLAQPVVEAGKVRRITGVMHDVTDQRSREQAIEQARLEAEKANVAKSQFLANMSHEIRTPMNGVTGMLALLLGSELTPSQRKQAETAHASASGLMRVLNDILDYSKLEANEMQIEEIEFDPQEVIGEVTAMLGLRAAEKGIELSSEVAPTVPPMLVGDPTRLRQVLVNLVGNAIKFTERGGVSVRLAVDTERLLFEVEDTGYGIAPGAIKTLFTRFAQAHGPELRETGGTGLGLAISKQLVEAMDGRIGVDSELARGSRFWFWVPLRLPNSWHEGGSNVVHARPSSVSGRAR